MKKQFIQEDEKTKTKKHQEGVRIIYEADFPALKVSEFEDLDRFKQFEKYFPFYRIQFSSIVQTIDFAINNSYKVGNTYKIGAIELEEFIEALKFFTPFRIMNNQDFNTLLDFIMSEFKDDDK
jgi:hypothetical protein